MIREFKDSDTDQLVDVWARAGAVAHPFLPDAYVAQVAKDMRNIYLPNAETWVSVVGGQPNGFIALLGAEIGGLFVDPDAIGQGYGRALVDHAVGLKGPLRVEVFKDNKIGLPFYTRYGFIYESEALHEPSGAVAVQMAMADR